MAIHRARARKPSSRRAVRALLLIVVVASGLGAVGPAVAVAADNVDVVQIQSIAFFTKNQQIWFHTARSTGNPDDAVTLTATEAADGGSVTITDTSGAAGGFLAMAPCVKTNATTAVCPTRDAMNRPVTQLQVSANVGDNSVAVDAPTLDVLANLGNGNDTVNVPRSRTAKLSGSGGDDKLSGGTGVDTFNADGGRDTIFAFNSPAARDAVNCGIAAVESPVDVVHADALDTVSTNCARVVNGP